MNDTDLSDEAFEQWARDTFELRAHKPTWQECRRRAQIRIHALESQFINVCTWGEEQLEQERRKAFDYVINRIAWVRQEPIDKETIDSWYRAFLQEREGK